MNIALESCKAFNLKTPGLELAKNLYEQLAGKGGAELGTQALFKLFDPDEQF